MEIQNENVAVRQAVEQVKVEKAKEISTIKAVALDEKTSIQTKSFWTTLVAGLGGFGLYTSDAKIQGLAGSLQSLFSIGMIIIPIVVDAIKSINLKLKK